jgi:hypothetical protein
MKIYLHKIVNEAEMIPRGYGLAYWEYDRNVAVVYPIPFNLVVRLIREIYIRLVMGICPMKTELMFSEIRHKEYNIGYKQGLEEGKRISKEAAQDLLDRISHITRIIK